jgi:hypothetical protein
LCNIGKVISNLEGFAMDANTTSRLSREEFIAQMRKRMEDALGKVADAVNDAPPGHLINASEQPVHDVFTKLRQEVYELALQMRVDAAEAAFPPSGGSKDTEEETQ